MTQMKHEQLVKQLQDDDNDDNNNHHQPQDVKSLKPNPLRNLHTIDDENARRMLQATLESVSYDQRRREMSEPVLNRPKKRFIFKSFMTPKQQPQPSPPDLEVVKRQMRGENEDLKTRVASLEMDQLEIQSLRHKVRQLEWALDVVRDDADRVRDDALTLLSQVNEQKAKEEEAEDERVRELRHLHMDMDMDMDAAFHHQYHEQDDRVDDISRTPALQH